MKFSQLLIILVVMALITQVVWAAESSSSFNKKTHSVRRSRNSPKIVLSDEENSFEEQKKTNTNHSHNKNSKTKFDSFEDDSESIEMPVKPRRRESHRHNYSPVQRPLFNLLLGILDTFKMSSKHDLKRAQEKEKLENSQQFFNNIKNVTYALISQPDAPLL